MGIQLFAERLEHTVLSTTLGTYTQIRTDQEKELAGISALGIENG